MAEYLKHSALTEAVYYILLSLITPLHGYGIMQHVEEVSQGRVKLGAGTLYGAISTLLEKQWIADANTKDSGRKKEYVLTPLGRDVLEAELKRLKALVMVGEQVLEGGK